MSFAFADAADTARTVHLTARADLDSVLSGVGEEAAGHARAAGFSGKLGEMVVLPGDGDALYGVGDALTPFDAGNAALSLPEGDWRIGGMPRNWDPTVLATALGLGSYQFTRYRAAPRAPARFHLPAGADEADALRIIAGVTVCRDLINTPAGDMLPSHLEDAARTIAKPFGAKVTSIVGDDLLKQNYPMIHAVGRASTDAPRLIELLWGDPSHPRVALVGKGVCFDSGGLNIKGGSNMLLMKKDMGGAANVLGLATMIMDAGLPVHLQVLVPAVENAISGNAFRPGDVLPSRKGLTVEIGNTDAEGRLVLGDALTRACEDKPDLVIDMATLTGAARIALGPELAPVYTDDDALAADIAAAASQVDDPVWRMPLWSGYDSQLEGDISDLSNTGSGPMAGSITAALFLRRFVDTKAWVHLDIYGWNPKARPGRPLGGEMLAGRALYEALKARYGAPHG
ncbi:leucyl aminopeptidase PepB, putative [Glycocaulis alkaliphilus]|uniref:Leucyl aminopeptidase PepB, putative n=1 Tax=Glycocaulis alkaliphilus TaxID=1434191 RepID=A0A3T0E7H4_9PROT|nr:leucyl aminopeptidase family protein [Glycocaulis alkaliphilus]AZU03259.1 leucyl aminopeptidase PepB, putative [Glycocaulis alkaliphilus]GGB72227.1 leucyl aminopeptidase [Glycocaulis alkaliphilus]